MADGKVVKGQYKDGRADGEGIIAITSTGHVAKGKFVDGNPVGEGIIAISSAGRIESLQRKDGGQTQKREIYHLSKW
jgi:hypothetical protein